MYMILFRYCLDIVYVLCAHIMSPLFVPFMDHMQGEELIVVVFIEPGAGEVIQAQAGAPGERQRVNHKLGDGSLPHGLGLVVKDVDRAVADLQEVDVAGQGCVGRERHGEAECGAHMCDVFGREKDRHLDCYRNGVSRDHGYPLKAGHPYATTISRR